MMRNDLFNSHSAVHVAVLAAFLLPGAGLLHAQTTLRAPTTPNPAIVPVRPAPPKLTDVLSDKRPPHILTDAELLNRLALLEVLIDADGVARSIKLVAIGMREFDRAERDRRRAINMEPDKFPIAVLADIRPGEQLNEAELRLRLEKIRDQLARPGIPLIARDQLRERQKADTRALEQRLKGIKPQQPAKTDTR